MSKDRNATLGRRRRLLLRTHGGAISAALLVHRETPFLSRANANADAIQR
jgi:hypothetical protein